ncbi:MAG: DMT family transporter, partial [Pseudomonadota bacterium]
FAKIALIDIPPMTLVFLRVSIAAVALGLILKASGSGLPGGGKLWTTFALMGLLNNLIPFSLLFWGQTHIGAGLASIFNSLTPLFTVLIAHVATQDERLSIGKSVGILLGLVGVTLIIGVDVTNGATGFTVLAMLACVAAAASYGVASVYGRRFGAKRIAPMHVAFGQLASTSVLMLPVMIITDRPWSLGAPSATSWIAVLILALLCTAIAYVLFFEILERGGATNISLVTFIVPVSAIILSSLFLQETLSTNHVIGISLILLGLGALDGRLQRRWSTTRHQKAIPCQN